MSFVADFQPVRFSAVDAIVSLGATGNAGKSTLLTRLLFYFLFPLHQLDLVLQLHDGVPRFGHSNSIALLASSGGAAEDYKDGVRFCY